MIGVHKLQRLSAGAVLLCFETVEHSRTPEATKLVFD